MNNINKSTKSDNNDSHLKNGDRFKADDDEDELLVQERTPLRIQQVNKCLV